MCVHSAKPVETMQESRLLLYTDKEAYALSENITIIMSNIGDESIYWVGRCPVPWDIFTSPDEVCVFATIPCFCLFELLPGENVTYIWNKADPFTVCPIEPGMYVVRDNQGWGFSTRFMIVDADIVVPDDYPAIQEAVNNADDGNTVFVRNGAYCENVVVNKTIALTGESNENTVVDGGGVGTVVRIDSDGVTISGFEIRNCSMEWGNWGIALNHSSKSVIKENTVTAVYAISIEGGSQNRIEDNDVVGHDGSCIFNGLQLVDSNDNVVSENNLSLNCHFALTIRNSSNNRISSNYISGHFVPFPFTMDKADNNSIVGNTMWQPAPFFGGHIHFKESKGNVLYHNSFLADEGPNTMSIDEFSTNNTWDNGCEGNYWSDYSGTDSNNDGVGDTPFYIDENNQDDYPLVNPHWNPADVNHDLRVDIYDAVLICGAYTATPSAPNWNPHCDIAEPYEIIDIYDAVLLCDNYGEEYSP